MNCTLLGGMSYTKDKHDKSIQINKTVIVKCIVEHEAFTLR